MKISPVSYNNINHIERTNVAEELTVAPTTVRRNSLADMEFNIVADTIRSQNLKNQMNVRLMNLKRSLNSCMAQSLYNKQ